MSESVPMLSPRRPAPCLLATALALALASPAALAETASDNKTKDPEAVVVTASPLKGNAESVATPVDVLYGEDLDKAKAGTLGETVAKLPGVQTTYFGTGVGRPQVAVGPSSCSPSECVSIGCVFPEAGTLHDARQGGAAE